MSKLNLNKRYLTLSLFMAALMLRQFFEVVPHVAAATVAEQGNPAQSAPYTDHCAAQRAEQPARFLLGGGHFRVDFVELVTVASTAQPLP
ncbi:hypothetical protein KFS98_004979 [Salmonella enterica]|nr:hypothetical protein [Salmonella enterica]